MMNPNENRTPYAADPECMRFALQMITKGLPEFTVEQKRRIESQGRNKEFDELKKCQKPTSSGLRFSCVTKVICPEEQEELRKCWAKEKDVDICSEHVFKICDKLLHTWHGILLAPTYEG
jgi:hypothetical protein